MKKITFLFAFVLILRSLAQAQSVADPALTVQLLVSGLNSPTTMAFIGPSDILVLQKNDGRVRRLINGVLQPGEVHDLAVDSLSERGLLGIAAHPQFPTAPFIYLYFTESSTGGDTSGTPTPAGNRVYRYVWNGSRLTNPLLLLDLPATPGPNHDGGVMAFGPDGKLYIVIGDLNRDGQLQNFSGGPPPDNTGVIFRLNDNGTVPPDNPFFSQGGNVARYYAYGIRNSFGITFDPVTGDLWMSENGPNLYDEINLVEPGFNSGWEQIIGPVERDPEGIGNLVGIPGAHYRDPSFSWLETVGPTGLAFLDSTAMGAQYLNNLFVGDINGGVLYRFRPNITREGFDFQNSGLFDLVADNSSELSELVFGTGFGGITDVKVGPDGFLYIVSFLGRIFRIVPAVSIAELTVSPTSVPGGTVMVNWTGITSATPTDWIGLYSLGAADTSFIDWIYVSCSKTPASARVSGSCPFVIPASLATGNYELRLFSNNGFNRLGISNSFIVQGAAGPNLSVSPATITAGGTVTVNWTGITSATPTDWIGLYLPGAADTSFVDWIYMSCSKTAGSAQASGSCPFVIPASLATGNYELRLFSNNGFNRLAVSNIFIVQGTTGPNLSVSPASITAGGTVTANWTGIASPTPKDWIGLYLSGAADTAFVDWIYVNCSKSAASARAFGSCAFVIPASLPTGNYEFRLFTNDVFTRLASSNSLTVQATMVPAISAHPIIVVMGGSLTASWGGIGSPTPTDWIGIYVPGAVDTAFIDWIYVSCTKTPGTAAASGSCSFPTPSSLPSGNYELRLLANDGFTTLAISNRLNVGFP